MTTLPTELIALQDDLGLVSLRFWLGLEPCLDVLAHLRTHGVDEPDRVLADPEQPLALRLLIAWAPHLQQATQVLAGLTLQGRGGGVAADALLAEAERTASVSHLEAMARALHNGRVDALREPLEQARAAGLALGVDATAAVAASLADGEARELARALVVGRERPSRLARALQGQSPVAIEAWRGELRPLLEALLTPVGASLGMSPQRAALGVPVLVARHPGRPGRWVLHLRPSASRSVARALALRCGEVLGRALGLPPLLLGGLLAAQLGASALWRGAGLASSQARELAVEHRRDLLRWVLRLHAYGSAGDDDVRAWAAGAAARLHERDDVFGALLWQGPLPDPNGLPTLRCGADLRRAVVELLDGLRAQQALVERVGDDWPRAPEAAEALLEIARDSAHPVDAAPLWRLLED